MSPAWRYLEEARKQGLKPVLVLLTLYPAKQPRWWQEPREIVEVTIDAGDNPARMDMRSIYGCDVLVACSGLDDRTRAVVRRVTGYADSIVVCPLDDADVRVWKRGEGWDGASRRETA